MSYNHHRSQRGEVYGSGHGGGSSSASASSSSGPVGALSTLAEWAAKNLDVESPVTQVETYVGE
jgi:hypothetical protein